MKVTSIKNISNERILINVNDGKQISLPPNCSHKSIDVTNMDEISEKVSYIADLTEVNTFNNKTQLYD